MRTPSGYKLSELNLNSFLNLNVELFYSNSVSSKINFKKYKVWIWVDICISERSEKYKNRDLKFRNITSYDNS